MKKILSMLTMIVLAGALVFSMTACGKSGTATIPSEAFSEPDVDGIMNQVESAYAELESELNEVAGITTASETE